MKKHLTLMLAIIGVAALAACSDAELAKLWANGKKHRVSLYSGGKLIGQWETSGKIENEDRSNGYYFNDDKTGKLVMINGDVIIEVE